MKENWKWAQRKKDDCIVAEKVFCMWKIVVAGSTKLNKPEDGAVAVNITI